uniref:Histone H2A n=1 Tax=Crypthecodinium cohnii TaxID=2866 RepID=A0A6N0X7L6_CRYCO|nr:histone H2A.X2 [Crypthecodinium cohnii]
MSLAEDEAQVDEEMADDPDVEEPEDDGEAGDDGEEDEDVENDGDGDGEGEPGAAGAGASSSSGKPAKGIVKDKEAKEKKARSLQDRCNLTLPIGRFTKQLKRGGYAKRVAVGGSVFLTSVIEYVTAEILELAGNAAKDQGKNRILPRHIQLAIRSDEELNKYMSNVTIAGGGVIPNVHSQFLPRKSSGKDGGVEMSQEF